MKIQSITTYLLNYREPNDHNNLRHTVICRIESSDGIIGWGEGIAMWPEACKATIILIQEGFASLLKEENLLDIEKIWRKLREHQWWYGRSGIANFAISALDMSLWDLKGKYFAQPLYRLFGGKAFEKIPANASIHLNQPTIKETIRDIIGYFENGYQSVKMGFAKKGDSDLGKNPIKDVLFIKELRKELGDKPQIMVDFGNGMKMSPPVAIETIKKMSEYDVTWFEEPLYPTDWSGYRRIKESTDVVLASGEREWSPESYNWLMQEDIIDVFGIDPARTEGITGFQKVAGLVELKQRQLNAHAWSTAINTSASLHCSICSPRSLVFEFKPIPTPVQFEILDEPIVPKNGYATPSDKPGLGIQIKENILEKYSLEIQKQVF